MEYKVKRLRTQDGNIQVRTKNFQKSEKGSKKGQSKREKKKSNTRSDVA